MRGFRQSHGQIKRVAKPYKDPLLWSKKQRLASDAVKPKHTYTLRDTITAQSRAGYAAKLRKMAEALQAALDHDEIAALEKQLTAPMRPEDLGAEPKMMTT